MGASVLRGIVLEKRMTKLKIYWRTILVTLGLISLLVFTPLVIPAGKYNPELFGLPYTLWVGMGVYLVFLILIWTGISVHSKLFKEEKND